MRPAVHLEGRTAASRRGRGTSGGDGASLLGGRVIVNALTSCLRVAPGSEWAKASRFGQASA